ncbi:MAG: helix-turn-helix domain-containing protein [archaeon]
MMKRHGHECPVFEVLSIFEKKWALAIIKEIHSGTTKFNGLKRNLKGINPSILSRRLAELEKKGLVSRRVSGGKPVSIEYVPTEKLKRLFSCWPR